ncbi:MAG: HAD-IC family P-type ATPase [Candidatus Buchananbacteria bacterium]|nr:HAD-IC family P-type ATPase [Candidatus Buchananbacteria bacterium]
MEKNTSPFEYATINIKELLSVLNTSQTKGLDSKEAKKRSSQAGPNQLENHQTKWWHILGRQFKSPFIYLLIAAGLVAFSLGGQLDAAFIFIFIFINTVLGFYQEFRSDRSLKLLKNYLVAHTTVIRSGHHENIDVRQLVVGDVVDLKSGDIVPADCRVLKTEGLSVNESILTGESITVNKIPEVLDQKPTEIYQARNIIFAGTTIASGSVKAVVVGIGRATTIGSIAKLTAETAKESEFSKGIGKLSSFILRLVSLTIVIVFLANIIVKGDQVNVGQLLVFSIALAVSVIPEALPVVSTFSLSRGALLLAKKKVVVKRLSAIEDLGGIDVLCTDKTGTITENRLTIVDQLKAQNHNHLVAYGALSAPELKTKKSADPFDTAFSLALTAEDKKFIRSCKLVEEIPFDPIRRRNSVLVKHENKNLLIVRGAPEELIKLSIKKKSGAYHAWIKDQGKLGRRVLALATKELGENQTVDLFAQEHDLDLAGFIAFEDPIKSTTKQAVTKARDLGVQVKIITGDAPEVAGAVAVHIGLIDDPTKVITGDQFNDLDPEQQKHAAETYAVFARISPEQKHQIVSLLDQTRSVGFLGEGVNDAPALKAATVSLVVQSGSDISREAADVILLQKSLAVIIDGIQEGRQVFANTLKYIRATLSSNFGNFYAVAISSLFIDFLPMLPVQILLLNLLSDFPMISIAADTTGPEDVARPQRYNIKELAMTSSLHGIISTVFDFIFFALYFRISADVLQTNWFVASIITELVFLFSIRTKKFALTAPRPAPLIIWLSSLAFMATLIIPFTAIGHDVFHFVSPSINHLATILILTAVYFMVNEIVKLFYQRIFNNQLEKTA